ncbi:vitamin K epoxide reductase family protein [Candidatus Saccharibacteria bacterium]|nr:vitamin K epoxide reductase family protein [Candidatus Saccharibacteria bacterium]
MKQNKKGSISKRLPYILIVCALLGLLAAFTLTYDKIHVLQNPNYDPGCNINPVLSCGSIMKTEQASLLGVPNTIFGIMGYTALLTFGVLILAGGTFKKWVWQVAQVAALSGLLFMGYLFFQGVFRIGAICPWCFLTWMVTIPVFVYITAHNLENSIFRIPKSMSKISNIIIKNPVNIIATMYTIVVIILTYQFWYYWKTLF